MEKFRVGLSMPKPGIDLPILAIMIWKYTRVFTRRVATVNIHGRELLPARKSCHRCTSHGRRLPMVCSRAVVVTATMGGEQV